MAQVLDSAKNFWIYFLYIEIFVALSRTHVTHFWHYQELVPHISVARVLDSDKILDIFFTYIEIFVALSRTCVTHFVALSRTRETHFVATHLVARVLDSAKIFGYIFLYRNFCGTISDFINLWHYQELVPHILVARVLDSATNFWIYFLYIEIFVALSRLLCVTTNVTLALSRISATHFGGTSS